MMFQSITEVFRKIDENNKKVFLDPELEKY